MKIAEFPTFNLPYTTATAGTPFVGLIPGLGEKKGKIVNLRYTSGPTAHTLTILRALNKVKLAANVAKDATTIILASDPGKWGSGRNSAENPIAANDYIAYRKDDGSQEYKKISAATTNGDGTVSVTVSAVGSAITKSDFRHVFFLGVPGDTDPNTGLPHPTVKPPVSATTQLGQEGATLFTANGYGEPMLFYSDNITDQGYLEHLGAAYGE